MKGSAVRLNRVSLQFAALRNAAISHRSIALAPTIKLASRRASIVLEKLSSHALCENLCLLLVTNACVKGNSRVSIDECKLLLQRKVPAPCFGRASRGPTTANATFGAPVTAVHAIASVLAHYGAEGGAVGGSSARSVR
jgi:hypothetical protein